mgnify:CR=1 FL=1
MTDVVLAANLQDNTTPVGNGHDHGAWLPGFGRPHPHWLGYTLGYRIVDDGLEAEMDTGGDTSVDVRPRAVMRRPADASWRTFNHRPAGADSQTEDVGRPINVRCCGAQMSARTALMVRSV